MAELTTQISRFSDFSHKASFSIHRFLIRKPPFSDEENGGLRIRKLSYFSSCCPLNRLWLKRAEIKKRPLSSVIQAMNEQLTMR